MARSSHNFFCLKKLLQADAFHLKRIFKAYITPKPMGYPCNSLLVAQILRATVCPDQKNWYQQVPMTEFAINSAINALTGYALFDLNYAYMPSMIKEISLDPPAPPGVRAFASQALYNIKSAHDAIIVSRVFHHHHANNRHCDDPEINEGDLVYLSTKNLLLPKG
jgi:hypothetical protein